MFAGSAQGAYAGLHTSQHWVWPELQMLATSAFAGGASLASRDVDGVVVSSNVVVAVLRISVGVGCGGSLIDVVVVLVVEDGVVGDACV